MNQADYSDLSTSQSDITSSQNQTICFHQQIIKRLRDTIDPMFLANLRSILEV